jgi:ketosteroid isomerase-like protein
MADVNRRFGIQKIIRTVLTGTANFLLQSKLETLAARLSLVLLLAGATARPQEIPLDNCGQLPIVKASVNKRPFQFLLDTGADITLLNVKSFSSPETAEITMESWTGSAGTPARKVTLRDFTLGEHVLQNLTLLAVDLTPVERSCQKRVDGVLGADMIARLGLTIDLKNHVAVLNTSPKTAEERFSQLEQHQAACVQAFNRSDEKTFEQCLDPNMVLQPPKGDCRGREAIMKHFKEAYFGQDPPVLVSLTPRQHHEVGPVIWIEYDMLVTVGPQVMKGKGTALYQKSHDRWLMSNMNYSLAEQDK